LTQKELSKLQLIQKEIEFIKKEMSRTDSHYQYDKVKGSSSQFPYTPRNFNIEGFDYSGYYTKLDRLNKKLSRKLDELMDERDKINEYIDSIDDSMLRMILSLKHVNGLTWEQIGKEIGYSKMTVRRKYYRYFRKCK
jgi:DNA-directed RNA polymerase specialized sigma subunit